MSQNPGMKSNVGLEMPVDEQSPPVVIWDFGRSLRRQVVDLILKNKGNIQSTPLPRQRRFVILYSSSHNTGIRPNLDIDGNAERSVSQ